MNTAVKGQWGENKAKIFLENEGYRMICANFCARCGEIDIIAAKDGIVSFVEVKTRKNNIYGEASEHVTPAKQKKIIETAQHWMVENDTQSQCRFDIIEVYTNAGSHKDYIDIKINHIINAFEGA